MVRGAEWPLGRGPANVSDEMTRWLATYGASAALVSGGLFALGTVVLVLFYALEAPTVLASGNSDLWTPLGRTNDLLIGLSGLAAIPLAARVHDRWRTVKPWASVVVYAVALAAMLGIGVFGLISFTNLVPLTALGPFAVTALAGIGLWQLVVSLQSAEPAIHGRLRTLGIASGIGFLLELVAFLAIGGSSGMANPQDALRQPVFVAIGGIGLLASFIGYPIWAIWLGRRLRQR
jgi:hypothetical protein